MGKLNISNDKTFQKDNPMHFAKGRNFYPANTHYLKKKKSKNILTFFLTFKPVT